MVGCLPLLAFFGGVLAKLTVQLTAKSSEAYTEVGNVLSQLLLSRSQHLLAFYLQSEGGRLLVSCLRAGSIVSVVLYCYVLSVVPSHKLSVWAVMVWVVTDQRYQQMAPFSPPPQANARAHQCIAQTIETH